MRVKNGFLLRHVGEEIVVVATGDASRGFNGIIRLNETGEFLWQQMEQDTDEERLLEALRGEYDIDEASARRDIAAFIEKLKGADLLA